MPFFWVSESAQNLRLEDEPFGSGYSPATGPKPVFHLSYRQTGETPEESSYFSVGTNWSCSFRAYVIDLTGGWVRMHRGGAGWVDYQDGVPQFRESSMVRIVSPAQTYERDHPDGARDIFQTPFTTGSGQVLYFLTQKIDPFGNATTYNYSTVSGVLRLTSITDADGKTSSLYYENAAFPNRITKVVDPFSRTNLLAYDDLGYLTNTTDVAGLSTSFKYDAGNHRGWITNMNTPYGATAFRYGGVDADSDGYVNSGNFVNRFVEITLPTGGKHLYVFRLDCTAFMPQTYSPVPTTAPLPNTLDNVDQYYRNSFHWNPLQYAALSSAYLQSGDPNNLTSADYMLGALRHWLMDPNTFKPVPVLSLERAPSPDGSTPGLLTWYDYDGKSAGNNYIGGSALHSLEARVLPDGTTSFQHLWRNSFGAVTNLIATYTAPSGSVALRTNLIIFAANGIDLLQTIGPNQEQVVSNYFAAGNVYHQPDASYDALNQQTLYTYSANRLLTSIQRPSGLTTTNLYFTSGTAVNRLQTTIDLEISRTNAFTHASGLVQSHTDERGLVTTNFWDNLQRLTGIRYPDSSTVSNIYTALDRTAAKDRLGYWSYFGFNPLRQMVAATNANGVVARYGYCDCGALFAVTNAWNTPVQQVTTFAYDYQGNRTYTYLPDATFTNWFNSLAQIYQTGDGRGTRFLSYNNQGLLTNVSNVYGRERATIYDNEDRPLYVTDDSGVTGTNAFDVLGRPLMRTYPDGGREKFGYSARGLIAYTNQIGASNFFAYDPAGRKIFETNADNQLIQYYYDASGNLTNLVDGKGQSTKWNYDQFGRLTNKLDQAGVQILVYSYDADGRLLSRWSGAKGTTYYTNDAVGNLIFINYPSSPDVTLQYDALNRVTNMVDGVGTTLYTYTSGGQLFTEDGPFASDTVTNTYVNRLRTRLVLQQPTGLWTNGFIWDAAGRLTNVTSQAGSFAYQYAAPGPALIQKLPLPNGAYITNTFDNVARLLTNKLNNSSQTTLDSYAYIYNPANQRTNVTRADGSYYGFLYDKIGQLIVADSTVNTEDRGYFYDAAWNLNQRTNNGAVSWFSVDNKNETTDAAPLGTRTYDANGNLTQAGDPTSIGVAYTYDDENRLIEVYTNYNPGVGPLVGGGATNGQTDFIYDGLGRLRERLEYVNGVFNSTTEYIYDGNRVIQERDVNNNPTVSYTRGSDLSGSLEGAGGIGGLLARSTGYPYSGNWTNHNYYFADGNGNITYMINSSQAMVASYRYDPFGNTISSSGGLSGANVYRFSSKEVHANSGMYYYLYRFYDPNLQRWLNRDPLGEPGFETVRKHTTPPFNFVGLAELSGSGLYTFVRNEPTIDYDALGLTSCEDTCWDNWKKEQIQNQKDTAKCIAVGYAFCAARKAPFACYFWVSVTCGDKAALEQVAMFARLNGCLSGCPHPPGNHQCHGGWWNENS